MLRILVPFLLLAATATAQTGPPVQNRANEAGIISQQFSSADTLKALHSLFKQRRTGGKILLGTAAVFTVGGMAGVTSTSYLNKVHQTAGAISLFSATVLTLAGIIKFDRFSEAREQQVINDFTLGKPLPIYIKRQLKRQQF